MLAFEVALALAEAEVGVIPQDAAAAIAAASDGFDPSLDQLRQGMRRDGVIGPSFVEQLRKVVRDPHGRWLHCCATSQDVVDTSLVQQPKQVVALIDGRLATMIAALERLRAAQGTVRIAAQTRMQRALPFMAADKIDTWLRPLIRDRDRLAELKARLLVVQFGGPAGTRTGLDGRGDLIGEKLAERLGLGNALAWHTARDTIAEFGSWLSLVSGTLGKLGADVALTAQNEIGAVQMTGGGSSSAMRHRSNPVAAEILVALARLNAGLSGTLHQALVHENERSGAACTLEWLALPPMAIATGAGLTRAIHLVEGLQFIDDSKL